MAVEAEENKEKGLLETRHVSNGGIRLPQMVMEGDEREENSLNLSKVNTGAYG